MIDSDSHVNKSLDSFVFFYEPKNFYGGLNVSECNFVVGNINQTSEVLLNRTGFSFIVTFDW